MKKIIEKWYKKIGFPKEFDKEFYDILESTELDATLNADTYDINESDGKKNLLMYLYFTEELHKKYVDKGIPEEIFYDTIEDIVRWTKTWTDLNGELSVNQLDWLRWHYRFKLFKIGRLQYLMTNAVEDYAQFGIKKGDPLLDIHIPSCGPLDNDECIKSINDAKVFIKKYFPSFDFKGITCYSWLLDDTLEKYLSENANIIKFQRMFKEVKREERFSVIPYVFKWNATIDDMASLVPTSPFAERIKEAIINGQKFYRVMGFLDENVLK